MSKSMRFIFFLKMEAGGVVVMLNSSIIAVKPESALQHNRLHQRRACLCSMASYILVVHVKWLSMTARLLAVAPVCWTVLGGATSTGSLLSHSISCAVRLSARNSCSS